MSKQSLWFLTLFSLVLVLGVYYVNMPTDVFNYNKNIKNSSNIKSNIKKLDAIETYKEASNEEREEKKKKIEEKLADTRSTGEEKNNYYEELKTIGVIQGTEENIEKALSNNLKLNCFAKFSDNSNLKIICISTNHDKDLAVKVMREAQNLSKNKLNISVKFQKK